MNDSSEQLLRTCRVDDLASASFGGVAIQRQFDRRVWFGPSLEAQPGSRLLATPRLGEGTVEWHVPEFVQATPFGELPADARRRAEDALRSAFHQQFAPRLAEGEHGALLARALNITDPDADIFLVDGRPVLTNWGYLPADIASDPELRRRHFTRGLGRILGAHPVPPFADGEGIEASTTSGLPFSAFPTGGTGAEPLHAAASAAAVSRGGWQWPAIASGLALFILLALLLLPRIGVLQGASGASEADAASEALLTSLEQQAASLRERIARGECVGGTERGPASIPAGGGS